jgi:GTP-binding protein Era
MGIRMEDDAQLIFVDTPGIFRPSRRLDRAMVSAAWSGAEDSDVTCLIYDASKKQPKNFDQLVDRLKSSNGKLMLVLNKIDLVKRSNLLDLAASLNAQLPFTETFMISALKDDGVTDLAATLAKDAPEGPWLFPEDQMSDMAERLFAAEITREQAFIQLGDELPYALTIETNQWQEFENGDIRIEQTVYIERQSQRAIVIGKGGARIRSIREAAQVELQAALERKAHLFIFVKVRENWANDPDRYAPWALDYNAE